MMTTMMMMMMMMTTTIMMTTTTVMMMKMLRMAFDNCSSEAAWNKKIVRRMDGETMGKSKRKKSTDQ